MNNLGHGRVLAFESCLCAVPTCRSGLLTLFTRVSLEQSVRVGIKWKSRIIGASYTLMRLLLQLKQPLRLFVCPRLSSLCLGGEPAEGPGPVLLRDNIMGCCVVIVIAETSVKTFVDVELELSSAR